MDARKLIVPGLVFFAGAVFGRLFGVKPLVKGAMAVASMSGMMPDAPRAHPRRVTHRPAPRRRSSRRSAA